MSMTAQEIKALPRTEEGIFDLSGISQGANISLYKAALEVYPVYAAYETDCNKKEGYPDIMTQMRVWDSHFWKEFSFQTGSEYAALLLATIEKISPEIYENYRELLDRFRAVVKKVLESFYIEENNTFSEGSAEEKKAFCETVKRACNQYLLLAEKYQMCCNYVG